MTLSSLFYRSGWLWWRSLLLNTFTFFCCFLFFVRLISKGDFSQNCEQILPALYPWHNGEKEDWKQCLRSDRIYGLTRSDILLISIIVRFFPLWIPNARFKPHPRISGGLMKRQGFCYNWKPQEKWSLCVLHVFFLTVFILSLLTFPSIHASLHLLCRSLFFFCIDDTSSTCNASKLKLLKMEPVPGFFRIPFTVGLIKFVHLHRLQIVGCSRLIHWLCCEKTVKVLSVGFGSHNV